MAVAAGVVFYGLLALFPAITALVSSYALFADTKTVNDHISFLSQVPPARHVFNRSRSGRAGAVEWRHEVGIASLLLAVWSANGGMKAIIDALNVVNEEKEKRGFFTLNAVSLAFTVGGVLATLTAIGFVVVAPILLSMVGLSSSTDALIRIGRWPALAIMLLLGLAILYQFAPSRRPPKWRWISIGSAVSTVTWMIGSGLLSFYSANFGHYDAKYGSLGVAIALMIWMWMSPIVVLFGAEPVGAAKPIGSRGATMADTIGASY